MEKISTQQVGMRPDDYKEKEGGNNMWKESDK